MHEKRLTKLPDKGFIELPELRHPKEIRRINDPEYCKYHRIISHPIENYEAFKKQVLNLAKKVKIH